MKVADMHCDTISQLLDRQQEGRPCSLRENNLHLDLERMARGGYILQNFALYTHLEKAKDPFAHAMEMLDLFYLEMEKNQDLARVAASYQDIERNMAEGKMSALLTIEEGGVCLGSLALLRDFYRLGVRMMTLTWNFPNQLASPNRIWIQGGEAYFQPETEKGLTETGVAFVEEMERLGMVIDLSHLGDAGIWQVLNQVKGPVVASHSNARAVASNPRNLTDAMIRKLSEKGGVAGINYCAAFLHDWGKGEAQASRIAHMVEHMKHFKQVGGIQCIGLGSDYDGIGGDLELAGPDQLPKLEREMRKAGFTAREVEAVFYQNVLGVYREVL